MTDLRRHVPPLTLVWDEQAPGSLWRVVDGTMVFADVSGFTAMTEKLSRRGRIGAEEIVETLNRVFGPMLRIAAARGGELLKFGGDALLFLFQGEEHPEQACDAAVEMRAALRQAAAIPTSVGRLSLSMSVGVHSGDIHLFLVGSPTRELLILGPGATATAQAEKVAEAGQIVVSPATADRLGRGAVRPREDGEPLLRRRAAHSQPHGALRPAPADPALLRTLFPQALGDYLGPAIPDPEHRLASIAFIRFSGTDALLAGPGPDALAEALHRTVSLVEEALEPEGVTLLATDLDSDGGKFFLGSGIPIAFEDNEGRMLRALRRIADADSPLPLQLGINRGHVFAAEVGIPERGAYTGMGDTTNTAARIMSKAPEGKLYAHPAVLENSRTLFAAEPVGPFPMKGKAVPLLLFDVGEELGTRDEAAAEARLPFLGRDEQLATVRSTMTEALTGTGGVLTVTGATGMGKTRLVREALEGADVDHLVVLRAEPYGSASAYRMLRDPMRGLLGIERADPETMGQALLAGLERVAPELLPYAPLLADVTQVDVPSTPEVDQLDPQYRPDRLADTVVRLMQSALQGRMVAVAEEAHWADAASAGLLDRIAAAAPGRQWLVVAIRRGEAGGFDPEPSVRVKLPALPAEVIKRLVIAATEATPLRPHEIATVVDRAEGNPLFVEEVTRVALVSGSMEALPESVGAAMSAQIDALPPHARRVLRYCAVLGRSFQREILDRTLAADGLSMSDADEVALSGFLEPDGSSRLRFRNSLVRDAAYEGAAYRIRARLHRTAAETLEQMSTDLDADAPTLALHYWRSGDAERTWRYSKQAGEEARRAYANVDAAEMYERAIEVSRRVPGVTDADRAELWSVLGELRELAGVLDGSVEAYRRAAALTEDPVGRARILARRARVHERTGALHTALRVVTQARRQLESAPTDSADAVTVQLDALVAMVRMRQEKLEECRRWALQTVAEARRMGDDVTVGDTLMVLGAAEALMGQDRVGEHFLEALGIFERIGNRPAEILISQGKLDEAEESLRETARVLTASGVEYYAAYTSLLQARVLLARNEHALAEARAVEVVARFRAMGSVSTALEASLVQAEAVIGAGRPAAALDILEEALQAARGEDQALAAARIHLVRGRALRALGRPDEAREALDGGVTIARDRELPYDEALLLRERSVLVAEVGDSAAAEADAARALLLLRELGALAS
ncbi:MAG: AAA family ATPase [Intrasporangiaceae bacterium]|nr:AAA family ATPase [Intrasporangiaceae bacterium]